MKGTVSALSFLVVVLACGYWWGQTLPPVGIIRDQLQAIDEGLYPRAYDYLSSSARAKLPFDEFVALIQNNSVVSESLDSSFRTRKIAAHTAIISGVVEGYGGYHSDAEYHLVKENDQWRIDSFEWAPPQLAR